MGTKTRMSGQQALESLLALAASLCSDFPALRTEVSKEAQDRAQSTARHKTGRLAGSIQRVDTGVAAHVFTELSYAWPVHAGVPSEGMAPNRFLLPLKYTLDPAPIWERLAADRLGG